MIVAAIALAILGYGLYWFFLKKLYGRVPEQGVLTIGVALMHRERRALDLGRAGQDHEDPRRSHRRHHIGGLSFPIYRLFVVGVGAARAWPALVHPGQDAGWGPSSEPAWTTRT